VKTLPVLALIAASTLIACVGGWSAPPGRVPAGTATRPPPAEPSAEGALQPQPAEPSAEGALQTQPAEPSSEHAMQPPPAEPSMEKAMPPPPTEALARPQPVEPRMPVFKIPSWDSTPAEPRTPIPTPSPAEIREERVAAILNGERFSNAPAGSALAEIRAGMSETEVREILGDPDARDRYTTSNLWIPFYTGPDSRRTDWIYRGEGRVVFSRNLDDGTLFAIRVLYDRAVVR
jgi:hypothetical protein